MYHNSFKLAQTTDEILIPQKRKTRHILHIVRFKDHTKILLFGVRSSVHTHGWLHQSFPQATLDVILFPMEMK